MIEQEDILDKDYLTRWIEAAYEVAGWYPSPIPPNLPVEVKEVKK